MPIKGAKSADPRHLYPIVGMRYHTKKSKSGKTFCYLNFLLLTPKQKVYMHAVPILFKRKGNFLEVYKQVLEADPKDFTGSAEKAAIAISAKVIERNGAFKMFFAQEKGFRVMKGLEFKDMGEEHPGVEEWPSMAIPGKDLFKGGEENGL